jgi:DNA-directed RNA polymerase
MFVFSVRFLVTGSDFADGCNSASAMRFKDCQEQQSYLEHASSLGNVELVYAGLDVLGSTPWKINRKIFDVVLKVWNSGERLCKIPPAVYDKPEPEKPADYDTDVKTKSIYGIRLKTYTQDKASNHSDRCSINYKIEISRAVSSPFINTRRSVLM